MKQIKLLLSNCAIVSRKKTKFIKIQEAKGLLICDIYIFLIFEIISLK